MPIRIVRALLSVGVIALGGCVGVAQPLPVGQVASSANCYAGVYQCVLPSVGQVGTPCACPGLGAPSYGIIR